MSNPDKALLVRRSVLVADPVPVPRRINIAVNDSMMSAIDRIIDNERVSLTEAVRRLVAYGDVVYDATRLRKAKLIVREPNGGEREVVVL
jgi:hypothetical protein